MRHVRDATCSYAPTRTSSTANDTATLALQLDQFTPPTLLSPSQTRRYSDYEDNDEFSRFTPEFQPNRFLKSPSRYFLAGFGIPYELDSSGILQISEKHHSSGVYDGRYSTSYAHDVKSTSRRLTAAQSFACMHDSRSSLGFIGDTSLPELAYTSSLSSGSLASIRSASDNDRAQPPSAFSLPFHVEDDVFPCPLANIGLFPDVNMYNLALLMKQPSVGVDPLDTMGRVSLSPRTSLSPSKVSLHTPCGDISLSCGSPPYNLGLDLSTRGVVGELTSPPLSQDCPSSGMIHDIAPILSTLEPDESNMTVHNKQQPLGQCGSHEGAKASPIIKVELDEPALYLSSPKKEECYIPPKRGIFSFPSDGASPSRQTKIEHSEDESYPSPILNAHTGIELAELTFRAHRYRARYPGQGIDRAWLMHFAGKLTSRGELIDDYRCYVVGCNQRNKRRDHIAIHIGAHVDQRAFSCSTCSRRFLRKNECKRHEATHTGLRPHHCEVCGHSFVRQDLLKRHVQRTHGSKKETRGPSAGSHRKKAKAR